jgi:uncharacterized secreted protein with C-terminal beta-propeller domain
VLLFLNYLFEEHAMLNLSFQSKTLLLVASSFLFSAAAQPVFSATATATKLKPVKITSRSTLEKLLQQHKTNRYFGYPIYAIADTVGGIVPPVVGSPVNKGFEIAANSGSNVSHSDTNIQVQGVDESDLVKVGDDGYIYQIANNQIRVVKGFPVLEMTQTADIPLPKENFTPSGIFIQNNKLVVMGSAWQALKQPAQNSLTSKIAAPYCCWWGGGYSQTRALIYDVSNHANPTLLRDVAIDGDYLDSRLIDDNLYFVSRSYPRYYLYGNDSPTIQPADMLPTIIETKAGKTTSRLMSVTNLSYFPDFVEPDYVIVTGVNVGDMTKSISSKAYLGAGELVYASLNNLYLSASKYNFGGNGDVVPTENTITTQIYKFGIDKGTVTFAAAGEVGGTALNQFSMDENGDYFRIATTTQNWYSGTNQSHNSLFVLDKSMQIVGKLEDLAKGESIKSTRFMGNRAYVVTFQQVDPLFAIDLTEPTNPFVAGELKIPGYSEYLHPYDENHLIGIGHDAVENGSSAIPQGLQMALFDVSDMKNPQQIYSVKIGDKGTSTELTNNHKALYWDAEKHIFGFPVDYYELEKGFDAANPWQYGVGKFQGAYIYSVTPENGFELKAKLTQLPISASMTIDYGKDGSYYSYYNYFVNRIVRVGEDSLFTLSNNQINAYDLANFKEQNRLQFNH